MISMEAFPKSGAFCNASPKIHVHEIWSIHGVEYHIPALFDELGNHLPALQSDFSYADWARMMRVPLTNGAHPALGRSHASSSVRPGSSSLVTRKERCENVNVKGQNSPAQATDSVLLRPSTSSLDSSLPTGEVQDGMERWRRSWSVVVRRDIMRQQRALVTQQREMLVTMKRSALAVQKEVRKRALRAQRLASHPQVQVRCKRIARDVAALTSTLAIQQKSRRAAHVFPVHKLTEELRAHALEVDSTYDMAGHKHKQTYPARPRSALQSMLAHQQQDSMC